MLWFGFWTTPHHCEGWQNNAWEVVNPISKPWWILINLVSNLFAADPIYSYRWSSFSEVICACYFRAWFMEFRDIAMWLFCCGFFKVVVAEKWCRCQFLKLLCTGRLWFFETLQRLCLSVLSLLQECISSDIQILFCISVFLGCWLCSSNCTYHGPHAWSDVNNTKRDIEKFRFICENLHTMSCDPRLLHCLCPHVPGNSPSLGTNVCGHQYDSNFGHMSLIS